ncbi:carboxymuconolactone decarboxylase family protein [Streptomyces monticola]|uniref:Carboxymuconolactone decarboxylase family protein n=1 Tax=Streptomyces monticola TaxID=2666263 RepID=A0ABW2JCL2_9ACTN
MPSPYLYTHPVPPKSTTGVVAEVHAQITRDFGIDRAGPFMVLSSAPELFTATWALLRESLLAGPGTRTGKEVAALGVSLANRCAFCVDAHTLLLHATGDHRLGETVARGGIPENEHHARVLAWSKATRVPGAPELAQEPFPASEAPGYIGTVLAFHFINRIVSALLNESLLPADAQKYRLVRSVAGRTLSRAVRRTLTPGESLAFVNSRANGPGWAAGTPVGPAYAALGEAAAQGAGLLSEADQDLVRETVAAWDGTHPPLVWDGLPGRGRPGARLAVLAALAPYRITGEDVAAWFEPPFTDHCLVHLIAYGAFLAVEHAEASLTAATAATTATTSAEESA